MTAPHEYREQQVNIEIHKSPRDVPIIHTQLSRSDEDVQMNLRRNLYLKASVGPSNFIEAHV